MHYSLNPRSGWWEGAGGLLRFSQDVTSQNAWRPSFFFFVLKVWSVGRSELRLERRGYMGTARGSKTLVASERFSFAVLGEITQAQAASVNRLFCFEGLIWEPWKCSIKSQLWMWNVHALTYAQYVCIYIYMWFLFFFSFFSISVCVRVSARTRRGWERCTVILDAVWLCGSVSPPFPSFCNVVIVQSKYQCARSHFNESHL